MSKRDPPGHPPETGPITVLDLARLAEWLERQHPGHNPEAYADWAEYYGRWYPALVLALRRGEL